MLNNFSDTFAGRKFLLTGASGLLGSALIPELLRAGVEVNALTRKPQPNQQKHPQVNWITSFEQCSQPVTAIVNLAGESIGAKAWSDARKQVLWQSRVDLTAQLYQWCAQLPEPPKVLLSASAVGVYGPHGTELLSEAESADTDCFSVQLCRAWEAQAAQFSNLGTRVVHTRFGVVLAKHAPAWKQLTASLKARLATYIGSGEQMFSWVHLHDVIHALLFLMQCEKCSGAFNVTAPAPLSQRALAKCLCEQGPAVLAAPVPARLIKMVFGQMAEELMLSGQAVVPTRLQAEGFEFRYPTLPEALPTLL